MQLFVHVRVLDFSFSIKVTTAPSQKSSAMRRSRFLYSGEKKIQIADSRIELNDAIASVGLRSRKMFLSETPSPLRTSTPDHYRLRLRPCAWRASYCNSWCGIVSGPVQLSRKPQDRATQPHPHLSKSFLRREWFSDGEGGCQSDDTSRSLPTMS